MLEIVIGAIVLSILIGTMVRILPEYERGVVFRLGRFAGVRGPGLVFLIPFWIERLVRVSLRTTVMDVQPQDVITKDNVSVSVNAVLYFRVVEPEKAIIEVEEFSFAISQLAQTTLRSVLGRAELDDLLIERQQLNQDLATIISEQCAPWGIQVLGVEVKHVDLPEAMKRAMSKQAEAERERRSKVINASGEFEAATQLADAAEIMSNSPITLQLRYLQTLMEIATEKNSTTIFPIPIDLIKPFMQLMEEKQKE